MISGAGFVGDFIDNTVGKIPGVGSVVNGATDFVFGEDATPAGGSFGQNILGRLNNFYGNQLAQNGTPTPLSQEYIDTLGTPTLNFNQRNPYQFDFAGSYNPLTAVGDAFTPQIERAQNILRVQGQRDREDILNDLNRRGLATSGITTDALLRQQENQSNTLANLASQLASQQALQQLQSSQFGANLQQNQQLNQALEFFRQQGATDAQAQALANELFQRQQAQGSAQTTRFNQQQFPAQQLQSLAALSGQLTPYSPASGGLLGGVLGAAGTAIGTGLGGPIGGAIGGSLGSALGGNGGGGLSNIFGGGGISGGGITGAGFGVPPVSSYNFAQPVSFNPVDFY
ncbi:MAG: hypothetical protein KC589_07695 [Nanoarchaeota archaeon]|nr:hypothetical protein [Nanoarchaeota archaeon]